MVYSLKAEIENISLSYCVNVKDCKTEKDLQRKGREAKRTMVKMIAKKLWEDKIIEYKAYPEFEQGVGILKAEIPVIKEINEEK